MFALLLRMLIALAGQREAGVTGGCEGKEEVALDLGTAFNLSFTM